MKERRLTERWKMDSADFENALKDQKKETKEAPEEKEKKRS